MSEPEEIVGPPVPKRITRDRERELVEQYYALAIWVAARLRARYAWARKKHDGDLESDCLAGLVRAAIAFDLERGVRFTTYAVRVITGYAMDATRLRAVDQPKTVTFLYREDGEPVVRLDTPDETSAIDARIDADVLLERLEAYSPRLARTVRARYLEEATRDEVARREGVCKCTITLRVAEALRVMSLDHPRRRTASRTRSSSTSA